MKAIALYLLLVFCSIECRKVYKPIDKNANIDFINMETGGGVRPGGNAQPAVQPPAKAPAAPVPTPAPTAKPPAPQTQKPSVVVTPPTPTPAPSKPVQPPNQIKPIPVNPPPAVNPITTPGPGSVKHLINYYDSQGKGSPIRPYSYSQAVKQG